MGIADEIRGYLSDRISGLIQTALQEDKNRINTVLEKVTEAFQSLGEAINLMSMPNINHVVEQWVEHIQGMIPPPPPPPPSPIPALYHSVENLTTSETQGEVLQNLQNAMASHVDGLAVFIVRPPMLSGWLSSGLQGPGSDSSTFRTFQANIEESQHALARAYHAREVLYCQTPPQGEDEKIILSFAGRRPQAFAVFPLIIKGKVAGLVYIDRLERAWTHEELDSAQILVTIAGAAIETMPTRLPIIRAWKEKGGILRRDISSRVEEPTHEVETEAQIGTEVQTETSTSIAEEETEAADSELTSGTEPEESLEESVQRELAEPETYETVEFTEEMRRQHDEARRFSRLLVSEIKLYNEQQVLLGRRSRDIFERLRDDILRSWKVFLERVPNTVQERARYFYQDLVNILADGDSGSLGLDHWPLDDEE